VVQAIFELLGDIDSIDAKMRLLQTITMFLQQNQRIADKVAAAARQLFESFSHEQLLLGAVLELMKSVIEMMGAQPAAAAELLTMLATSRALDSSEFAVREAGLSLLLSCVSHAPPLNVVAPLTPQILQIVDQDQQNAAGAMYALEAFTVLGGRDFVVGYGEQISHGLTTMVTWMRDSKDFRSMAQLLDVLASCVPQEAPTLAAGCVMALIQVLLDESVGDHTAGEIVTMLARMFLGAKNEFLNMLHSVAGASLGQILPQLVIVWTDKADCLLTRERKIVSAAALCQFLVVQNNDVLRCAGDIINVCIGVIAVDDPSATRKPPANALESRRRQIFESTVASISVQTYMFQCLKDCQNLLGDIAFRELMGTVDTAILGQLKILESTTV